LILAAEWNSSRRTPAQLDGVTPITDECSTACDGYIDSADLEFFVQAGELPRPVVKLPGCREPPCEQAPQTNALKNPPVE